MKVLLLTDCIIRDNTILLNDCKTRFHVYAYILSNYLLERGLTVIFHRFTAYDTTSEHSLTTSLSLPKADHVILIDHKCFNARPTDYIKNIRKHVLSKFDKSSVSALTLSNVNAGQEDMLFHLSQGKLNSYKNAYSLGWLYDSNIIRERTKYNGVLNILISEKLYIQGKLSMRKNMFNTYLKHILKYKQDSNITINIKKLSCSSITNDTMYNSISEFTNNSFTNPINISILELYKEFSNTHLFFITHPCINSVILSEMAFSNILIVSSNDYVNPKSIKEFDIMIVKKITDGLPWNIILDKINSIDTRTILIGQSWQYGANIILDKLNNFNKYYALTNRNINYNMTENYICEPELNYYIDTKNNNNNNNNNNNRKNNNKNNKDRKKYILLQSQCGNKITINSSMC